MKKAILIHNPTSGDGDHEKKDLLKRLEEAGYEVKYYSTDSFLWERFTYKKPDIIFVAGGDGTVQKLVHAILKAGKEEFFQTPIRILPYGTANNIATTLGIENLLHQFQSPGQKVGFDIGAVEGVKKSSFFIEAIGSGVFPKLVREMKAMDENEKNNEIAQAQKKLLEIIGSYQAQEAIIIADKEEITGKFLLVELMNIKYIGPNIELAPNAVTGDGKFVLVTVPENKREELKKFINDLYVNKHTGNALDKFAEVKKVNNLRFKWKGEDVHIDDEILENYEGEEIVVKNRQAVFRFMTT